MSTRHSDKSKTPRRPAFPRRFGTRVGCDTHLRGDQPGLTPGRAPKSVRASPPRVLLALRSPSQPSTTRSRAAAGSRPFRPRILRRLFSRARASVAEVLMLEEDGMLTIHLVRHGEMLATLGHRLCGPSDCALGERGRRQSEAIVEPCAAGGDWRRLHPSAVAVSFPGSGGRRAAAGPSLRRERPAGDRPRSVGRPVQDGDQGERAGGVR